MEFVTVESHFGVPENMIRAHTRNRCSEDFVEIIQEIAAILNAEESIEIFLLPTKEGSYRDIIKIVREKPIESVTAVTTIALVAVSFLTYHDSHEEHLQKEKMQVVDDKLKCLELVNTLEKLEGEGIKFEESVGDELPEVCGNLKLKKIKNDRFQTLMALVHK